MISVVGNVQWRTYIVLRDDGPSKRKAAVSLASDNVQSSSIAQLKPFYLDYSAR